MSPRDRAILLLLADALDESDGHTAGSVAPDPDAHSDLLHLGLVATEEGGYRLTAAGYAYVQAYDLELGRVGHGDSPSPRDVDAREPMLAALEADHLVEYRARHYALTDVGRERFEANEAKDAAADARFVAICDGRCAS